MPKPKKDKTLAELDVVEDSPQLSLFEILEPRQNNPYSNTIDLYDALPKYVWEHNREHDDLSKAVVTRKCTLRGERLTVKVKPAIIERNNGRSVLIYPGAREELVEDALRKLAVKGNGQFIDNKFGVVFTLYELEKELAQMGHRYKVTEIREALMVCRGATLECISEDRDLFGSENFFSKLGIATRKEYLRHGRDAKCYVLFHSLVNESVLNQSFRQYNYQLGMQIRSALARFIYKRMCHYWVQASPQTPYTPSLVSFLSQSPRTLSKRMPENVRAMRNALDTLIKHQVISEYEVDKKKDRQKIVDVAYVIWPHKNFVWQMKKSNKLKKINDLKALRKTLEHNNT